MDALTTRPTRQLKSEASLDPVHETVCVKMIDILLFVIVVGCLGGGEGGAFLYQMKKKIWSWNDLLFGLGRRHGDAMEQ